MRDLAHGLAQTRQGHQRHYPGRNHRAIQSRTMRTYEYDVCGKRLRADVSKSSAWRDPWLSPQISVFDICSFCHQYTGAWDILQALTPGIDPCSPLIEARLPARR